MPRSTHVAALAVGVTLIATARADVRRVPGDYPTIQEAIDAAVDGDEIELTEREYRESIDFKGKAIHLRPELPYDPESLYVILYFDLASTDGPSFRMVSGEGRDTIVEGVILAMPNWGSLNTTSFEIIDSSPTFVHVAFNGGGGSDQPRTRIVRSDVLFDACRPTISYKGRIFLELLDANLTFLGGRFSSDWYVYDRVEGRSTLHFIGTRFGGGVFGSGTSLSANDSLYHMPRDGYALPQCIFEDCHLRDERGPIIVEGRLGKGASFACSNMTYDDPAYELNPEIMFNLAADAGSIEFRGCSFTLSRYNGLASAFFTLEHGAELIIADSCFDGLRASSQVFGNSTFAEALDGSITIERTELLPDSGSHAASYRLLTGTGERLELRDVVLPPIARSTRGPRECLISFAGEQLTLDNVEVLTLADDDPDRGDPLVRFTSPGGRALIANTHLPTLLTDGCSLEMRDATVADGLHELGPALLERSGPVGGVLAFRHAPVTIVDSSPTDGGFTFHDANVTITGSYFLGGETAVYAEDATLDVRDTVFDSVNRDDNFASSGGVLIVDNTDLTVTDCVITACASGRTGSYPRQTASAIFSASGDSDVRIGPCIVHDAFVSGQGLFHTQDTASMHATNVVLTASRSTDGPLIASARGDSHITIDQCSFAGNEGTDVNTPNPRSLAATGSGATVLFRQSTIWGNTVIGNPFKGDVTFENSLVESVTPFDPHFARLPDDGGDGWYNSRSETPDYDESANNDYGDLRLLPGSPAIDAGDNAALPPDTFDLDHDGDTAEPLPLDLAGDPRSVDDPATPDTGPGPAPVVDLGVYEFQPPACPADLDANGVLNLDDIAAFATAFLADDPLADLDGNGVLNLDDIAAFADAFLAGCP